MLIDQPLSSAQTMDHTIHCSSDQSYQFYLPDKKIYYLNIYYEDNPSFPVTHGNQPIKHWQFHYAENESRCHGQLGFLTV